MREVIGPRAAEKLRSHCYRYDLEPFAVSCIFCSMPYFPSPLYKLLAKFCCCPGTDEGFLVTFDC